MRGRRGCFAAGMVVGALLIAAPIAHAGNVKTTHVPSSGCYKDICSVYESTTSAYVADPGEANRLTVLEFEGQPFGTALFTEAALPVRAGFRCQQRTSSSASCDGQVSGVDVGDGDDQVSGAFAGPVNGGDGNDVLHTGGPEAGGAGSDVLEGPGPLNGGPGSDSLTGTSAPNSFFDGDAGEADSYQGGAGDDSVSYAGRRTPVRLTIGAGGTEDRLTSIESVEGGETADTLTGDEGPNRLGGGNGSDVIEGAGGNDTLSGAELQPPQVLPGGPIFGILPNDGGNTVSGGAGNDVIFGAGGADHLSGGPGADAIGDGGGRDVVSGGAGKDHLETEGGGSTLAGGAGNDLIEFDPTTARQRAARISCGPGTDTVRLGTSEPRTRNGRDCERVDLGGVDFTVVGAPTRVGRFVRVRVRVAVGTHQIRLLSGRRLLGTSRAIGRTGRYRIKLTRAGRRLAKRGRTVTVERRAARRDDRAPGDTYALRFTLR